MTYADFLHIFTVLSILLLFMTISSLLDKLNMLDRQLDRMRISRDNWRDIARQVREKKQEEENDHG